MRAVATIRLRLIVAVAAWVGGAHALAAPTTRPLAPPASPEEVFADGVLHAIEVRIPAELWKLMEPSAARRALKGKPDSAIAANVDLRPGPVAEPFAYVRGKIEFDGRAVADVGIRFKGHFSYAASRTTIRRPLKLDFERFVEGQRFAGLAELNLNNQAVDPSQAREALAFEFHRALDVPAPRTGFALVYLSVPGVHEREFLGMYTLIEEVDKRFLRRHFGTSDGLLLKPSGMRGLAYLGEEWPAYEPKLRPKGEVNPSLGARMIDLARLLHKSDDAAFRADIGSCLEVDEFLRYVAVNSALCNFDSFLSTGHNYYLYVSPVDRRVRIIPWDMHLTFGGYSWVGSDAQIADTSMTHAYVDHNRLIERLLAVPQYRDAYFRHVRRLIDGPMSSARLKQRLAAIDAHVRAAGAAAAGTGKTDSPSTRPAGYERMCPPDVVWFVDRRVASIRAQLDTGHPGYTPAFNDPERVPAGWAHAVLPAAAILKAIDGDKDGRLSDAEVASAVGGALAAAGVPADAQADTPTIARAISALLREDPKKSATARAWTDWLVRQADANRDARLTAAEVTGLFTRLRNRADRDLDGQMGGRELLEALVGAGCPKSR